MGSIMQDAVARTNARKAMDIPIRLRVEPLEAPLVRFVPGITDDEGWIEGTAIDLSLGGTGLRLHDFIPRGADVRLLIGEGSESTMVEARGRVRRVRMSGTAPDYEIGIAFIEVSHEMSDRLASLLGRCDENSDGSSSRVGD